MLQKYSVATLLASCLSLKSANAVITPADPQDNWSINPPPRYLITFGDSYSQTGFNVTLALDGEVPSINNPLGNPPFPGYTTVNNGVNWLGEAGVVLAPNNTLVYNFAYGGATVNATLAAPYEPTVLSFIDQVTEFNNLLGAKAPPDHADWTADNSVFGIWFGVNDIGNSYYLTDPSYQQRDELIFDSYFGQVDILYSAGARRFVFLNAPPTYRTPMFISEGTNVASVVEQDIAFWNQLLPARAARWASSHRGVQYQIVDTNAVFTNILNNPQIYGAENATCYDSSATLCLWWNNYHPGAAINQGVGHQVSLQLQQMGFYDNGLW